MHKRPWCSHAQVSNIQLVLNITKPAQCVLVYQMISLELGFIAQLKGYLTRARYIVINVYIDHFSRSSLVYLQQMQISEETLESKNIFQFLDSMTMKYIIIIAIIVVFLTIYS